MLRPARKMHGFIIDAVDGNVGKLHDLYADDQGWCVRYLVVDTGPWLLGRRVLVAPTAVESVVWESDLIHVNLTRKQVEESPTIDLALPVSRQQFAELHDYYGWAPYWDSGPMMGMGMGYGYSYDYPAIWPGHRDEVTDEEAEKIEQQRKKKGDPHLRSVHELIGYHIHATDGPIGHIDDMFVDESSWRIHYLLAETRNILPGRRVLLSTEWITEISWVNREINVDVTREKVKSSPEFAPHPEHGITRSHETDLHDHYGHPIYW